MSSWTGKNTAKQILQQSREMTERMNKLPIKGKQTSRNTQKQIEKMRSDMQFRIARSCNVLVTFPHLHIVGNKVVLGDPNIWLPNCRIVSFETLIAIEEGREEAY